MKKVIKLVSNHTAYLTQTLVFEVEAESDEDALAKFEAARDSITQNPVWEAENYMDKLENPTVVKGYNAQDPDKPFEFTVVEASSSVERDTLVEYPYGFIVEAE